MIKKAVIPAAGLGTRLLPVTKELPKEMLPVVLKRKNGGICLKPMLQAVFEQLYDAGFREFCFVVGRGKRAIEDHFSVDESFVEYLVASNKHDLAEELQEFYKKVSNSTLIFVNQPKPKGFADALYQAKVFTGSDPFLMQAGDDLILSQGNNHLRRVIEVFEGYNADAAFFVEEVEDPRQYGVIRGNEIGPDVLEVKDVVEKPKKPPSNLAIIALYVFKPSIYKAIREAKSTGTEEVQLADALKLMLDQESKIYALKLKLPDKRVDIGNPESYLKTLKTMWSRL